MTSDHTGISDETPSYEDYMKQALDVHGELVSNPRMSQRLDNGIANIAQMHPAEIIEVYPRVGGLFDKFIADLPRTPNPTLAFNASSADTPTLDPKDPNPKFKA